MRWILLLLIAIAPAQAAYAKTANSASADRLSYVLLTGDGTNMMSGSTDDIRRARALQAGKAPLLFVRQDGVAYVIRDPAILRRAEAIMLPQREIGRRQGALGAQQGELGRRQGKLGAEQGRLARLMLDSPARQMGEFGRQQGELGRQQGELGRQQGILGQQQAALGRHQARLAQAAKPKLRALIADAIRRGVAQRVN